MRLKGLMLVFLISSYNPGKPDPPARRISTNPTNEIKPLTPLDSILGDKVSDDAKTIIRRDNFEDLKKIKASILADSSALYQVEQISPVHFLIRQRKAYLFARAFSIVAECKNEMITNFYVLNDYRISKYVHTDDGMLFFADNINNTNILWGNSNNILIRKLDSNLKPAWDYQPEDPPFSFFAKNVEVKNNRFIFQIEFFTGSTMLPANVLELTLNQKGKYVSSSHLIVAKQDDPIPVEKLRDILTDRSEQ